MQIKNKLTTLLTFVAISIVSTTSSAHERFMVPSHTLLSGEKAQAVTLISSISNDIFHPDRPLGNNNPTTDVGDLKPLFDILQHTVIDPKGNITTDTQWQAFKRLSVADVLLETSGTYRVALIQPDVHMTTFVKADGTPWREFGKNPVVPENSTNVVRRTTSSRVETFISYNSPNRVAINTTGVGLELGGSTHPNDLFAGETASFQLLFNGKPISNANKIKVIKAGTRHRNDRNEMLLAADSAGNFEFTPESAGFYFLSAETALDIKQPAEVDVKNYSLYITLEVFPE